MSLLCRIDVVGARKCRFCGEYLDVVSQPALHPKQSESYDTKNVHAASLRNSTKLTNIPYWRIAVTVLLVAAHLMLHIELSGLAPGMVISAVTLLLITPLIYLSIRWDLFNSRSLQRGIGDPVFWGLTALAGAFFKIFAPFDALFFLPWLGFKQSPELSAYKWSKN